MRSQQALKNMVANIILQVIVFISGILLPKFYLEAYGSTVNGMITSVNQFLSYLALAEAGVGTASVVALYKPLAEQDLLEVNSILAATKKFYNNSGTLFLSMTAALTMVYPFFIAQQLSSGMVRGMILVLAGSMVVDYFFVGKYKVFLTAKQEGYVVVLIQAAGTILNMVITIVLISQGFQVVLVRAIATFIYILRFFFLRYYVRKRYPEIHFREKPNFKALHQRNAALLHQVVGIIVNNTDVVVLTICLGKQSLLEVSVYAIYNLIVYAVNMFLTSFSNGLTAGFGELIYKGEKESLKRSFSNFEYMFTIILYTVTVCMWVLIIPFVDIYTANMSDVVYVRPMLGILFTLIVFLQNVRTPGMTLIAAGGHFKETRRQAIIEALINITVSLSLVWKFQLTGVLIGTICSYGYRSIEIMIYNARTFVAGTGKKTLSRLVRNTILCIVLLCISDKFIPETLQSFGQWFLVAIGVGGVSGLLFLILNYLCEPSEAQMLAGRIRTIVSKNRGES